MSTINILSGDPGKIRDSLFIIGTEINQNNLYILLAVRRQGKAYKQVYVEFAEISKKHEFMFNLIKANNTGQFVIEELEQIHHISVIRVTTTKDIKDETKKHKVETIDKNENVKWFLNMNAEHRIIFPTDEKCSADMLELKDRSQSLLNIKQKQDQYPIMYQGKNMMMESWH